MNDHRRIRERGFQKPFPGYKGRSMIDIYGLNAGSDGTKMLDEKPHLNGPMVVRHHPVSMKSPFGIVVNQKQEKLISCNQSSTNLSEKSRGTPMKTLIAQELSKETEYKQKSPTVIARLMGLESLPLQQPRLADRNDQRFGSFHDSSAGPAHKWQEKKHIGNQVRSPRHGKWVYKDVHEVWQQPSRPKVKVNSMWRGNHEDNSCQARMSLVREKFLEAKRLAMDEKFLQSKDFQDAIEILSSNRDLFLKFLEEPNSMFSKHFHGLKSVPSPQKRRITVLTPLHSVEENGDKESRGKQLPESFGDKNAHNGRRSNSPEIEPHTSSQPTRIVVLKPSPGKPYDIKKVVPLPTSSPKLLDRQGSSGSLQIDESLRSKELAKEITRRMRESLSGHIMDGDLLSSLLANGYIGDMSSFNRTESEYGEEEDGSLSESEIATPTLRHSWDFLNRSGSPFSPSSISRSSYSPESSVTREAKKRLCERLALVESNGDRQEQGHENTSASTLGEMFQVSRIEKQEELNAPCTKLSEEQSGDASSQLFSHMDNQYNENDSGRLLSRSISLPASSSVFGAKKLDVAVSSSLINEAAVPNELHKSKSVQFSLKGKLSSLFSSRNKKLNKDKLSISSSVHFEDKLLPGNDNSVLGGKMDGLTDPLGDIFSSHPPSLNPDEITAACTTSVDNESSNLLPLKDDLSIENYTCLNIIQDLDQPSTISVIEEHCVNGANSSLFQSSEDAIAANPQALFRSPPIGSVARSLSRNSPYLGATLQSSCRIKSTRILSKADEEEKQFVFVERLISSSGLSNYAASLNTARWCSLDAPLSPVLLDEMEHIKDSDDLNYDEMRSDDRLLFDCVNSALLIMSLETTLASYPWSSAWTDAHKYSVADTKLADVVWGIIKSWFCIEDWIVERKSMRIVVDTLVKRELMRRQWAETMWLEMNEFSMEIGGKLLEELVEEALLELIM